MKILVIDGQGGGLGKQLVAALSAQCPQAQLTAVGTNSLAASAMRKAGAVRTATGENAVVVNCRHADIIVGPIGIVVADALLGEITLMSIVRDATCSACTTNWSWATATGLSPRGTMRNSLPMIRGRTGC